MSEVEVVNIHGIEALKRSANQPDPNNKWNLEIRTKTRGTVSLEGLLAGVSWDWFARTLTNPTKETFNFYSGGSGGTLVATIELNYTDSTLSTILDGGRV